MTDRLPREYDRHSHYDAEVMHGDKAQTGDVCPWCGDPIQADEDLVEASGDAVPGDIRDWPNRIFHPRCFTAELAAKRADQNRSLGEYADNRTGDPGDE